MPLTGTGPVWGAAVKAAATIDESDLNASEKAQVLAFWVAACTVHASHIVANSLVTTVSGAPNSEHAGVIE